MTESTKQHRTRMASGHKPCPHVPARPMLALPTAHASPSNPAACLVLVATASLPQPVRWKRQQQQHAPLHAGEQLVSQRKTAPRLRFGTSDRDDALKIFISPEHEKGAYGRESPGPCAYRPPQSVGPEVRCPPRPCWLAALLPLMSYLCDQRCVLWIMMKHVGLLPGWPIHFDNG